MTGPGKHAVDLHAIGNAAIRKCLGQRNDRRVDRADRRIRRLGKQRRIARHQHHRTLGLLQCRPGRDRQPPRAVKLERQAAIPLFIRHLEQIDLRHRAGDVQQRVDAAKCGQRLIDDCLGGRGVRPDRGRSPGLGAGRLHRRRRLLQIGAVPATSTIDGKIPRETDCGRTGRFPGWRR